MDKLEIINVGINVNPRFKSFSFASLLAATTFAHAQWYGELDYVSAATTRRATPTITVTTAPAVAAAFMGYQINENFAAEAWLGTGLGGTDVKVNGSSQRNPVTATWEYVYGAYAKPRIALSGDVELFARFGYLKGKSTSSSSSFSTTDVKGDWTYGIGASFKLSNTAYVTASWMNLYNKDDVKADGWMIGYGLKF